VTDVPESEGAEARAGIGVEAIYGADEANVAFGDEFIERNAAIGESACDGSDQTHVGLDELRASDLVAVVSPGAGELLLALAGHVLETHAVHNKIRDWLALWGLGRCASGEGCGARALVGPPTGVGVTCVMRYVGTDGGCV
jgi:hypothetical protein